MRIRFTQLPAGVGNTSAIETSREENIVALRQNLTPEQQENSIAHELLHVILQGDGFAAVVHTPENAPQLMAQLGFTITSCVDDPVVDRRMSKLGFRPELLNHDTAEQMKLNPPRFSSESFRDPIVVDGNALLIVCFNFRRKYQNDEIETSWRELNPDVVARSHVLAAQIGDITCDDANACLSQKKHIRDILGFPITFCNPLTGTYE